MSHRLPALAVALAVMIVVALFAQFPATAQTQSSAAKAPAAAKAWTPLRTPDGKPDLQGIWSNNTLTPLQRPKGLGTKEFYTDQELAEISKKARTGDVGEEGDLGAARPNAVRYDLELYGFDPGKLRYTSKRTSLIVGPEGIIPTDGRPHVPQNIRLWEGDSVGHWEGDTLVVDTTNFTNRTNFRGSSEKLHLIERFTRTADNMLMYQFTVEDPTTWAKPWTAEIPWTKTKGPLYESACHEGNNMIENILRGARVAEAEAEQKKGK